MNTAGLQAQLFQHLKNKLAANASLVDDVATVLHISTDSAYRRIRGEKTISLEELILLCNRYGLSADSILNIQADTIQFQGKYIDPLSFRFEDYLHSVKQQVQYIASFRERKMYYLCKDIPIFYHYQSRNLAAFKYLFWHKTLLQSPQFTNRKVALHEYPDEVFEIGQKALHVYNSIDSVEIWNIESLNSTLRQVEFYHDTKAFRNQEDLLLIYESLEKLFTYLEKQAELGYKCDSTGTKQRKAAFNMYLNEVVIGDNSVLAQLDSSRICFLAHSAINFMATRDVKFCDNMYNYYQTLIRKSTLISTVSEPERSRFFNGLRKRIAARKENLGATT